MPIYADKKGGELTGRFRVEVQVKGQRLRDRFDTYAEAEIAEKEFREKLKGQAAGAKATKRKDTRTARPDSVQETVERFGKHIYKSEARLEEARMRFGKLTRLLGPISLDIDYTGLLEVVDAIKDREGGSASSVNNYLSIIRTPLSFAKKSKYISEMPDFPWQTKKAARLRWVTRTEQEKLLATLRADGEKGEEVADFVWLSIQLGTRRGELLSLERKQLDAPWLRLWETKTDDPRSVPMTPEVYKVLKRCVPWSISEWDLRYRWNKAKEEMGLAGDKEFTLHACRHTTATRLVENGTNLKVIQKYLGHRRIETTAMYAKASDETLLEAARVLGEDQRGATGGFKPAGGSSVGDEVGKDVGEMEVPLDADLELA